MRPSSFDFVDSYRWYGVFTLFVDVDTFQPAYLLAPVLPAPDPITVWVPPAGVRRHLPSAPPGLLLSGYTLYRTLSEVVHGNGDNVADVPALSDNRGGGYG